jgi:hypothetical protein
MRNNNYNNNKGYKQNVGREGERRLIETNFYIYFHTKLKYKHRFYSILFGT